MGDRRTNDRRNGDRRIQDRRVGDRRESKKGTITIKENKIIVYAIAIVIITAFIVTLIFYLKNKIDQNQEEIYQIYDEDVPNIDLLMNVDKYDIKQNEEAIAEIKANNIYAREGITMFETLINYDSNVFEIEVVKDNKYDWSSTSFLNNYLIMNRNELLPSNEDQVISKIKIKAKENSTPGIYKIEFIDPTFTIGENQSLTIPRESLEIKVSE